MAEMLPDLANRLAISDDARALIEPGLSQAAYLERLKKARLLLDAILVQAARLPVREALAWAVRSAEAVQDEDPLRSDAIAAARDWLAKPDAGAGAAAEVAETANYQGLAACLAQAVTYADAGDTDTAVAAIHGVHMLRVAADPPKKPDKLYLAILQDAGA